ncbi:mitogen-activated protein kinase kinase kinase 5 [Euphorbia peplus]|nr:mitogen-activated protein kinase kinase kinase 5 [Euphorbia peplus]
MRWLHSLSFSPSNPSSSSSSSSSCSNCASSSASASSSSSSSGDHHFPRHSNSRSYLRGGAALALRFGGGSRFSRSKKLAFFNEHDVSYQRNSSHSNGDKSAAESDVVLTRSPSSSSVPSRLSTSMPLPLPLPVPVQSGEGDSRFLSPRGRDGQKQKEIEREREREKERIDGVRLVTGDGVSCSTSPISRDRRKMVVEHLDIKSPGKSQSEFYLESYLENMASPPTKSAPSSPFASPLFSPHILNSADLLPYYQMIAKGNQAWSAPEMATLDIPGLPPPAFFDYSAFSTDNSPLHSPPNRSPRNLNPRSPSGTASPLTTRLSVDGSCSGRDVEVHPLPLPPGASKPSPSPSTPMPQVMVKPDSIRLKSQWQKGKLIGRGTFGSVYVASNRETGALCAMKEVDIFPDDPKSAESIKQLEQEIKVLSQLKHPNIVQYYGSEIVEDHFNIYLEYVHPGSINKYAREHCGAITENVVRSFTRHILSGLAYLHSMKTIHRDIKGANLLVDASGVVKLADFGMSKLITGQAAELSLKGSPYWMAPELMQAVMQKDTHSDLALAVDIWSLGCTIIEMFTGKPPWSDFEGAAAMFKVLKDTPPVPEALSPEGRDFLSRCFKRNPAERASASMLLEHRWLKNLQQLEIPSSTHSINGMKLTDISQASEVKFDQIPSPINHASAKGKVASESFRNYNLSSARLNDIILARLST